MSGKGVLTVEILRSAQNDEFRYLVVIIAKYRIVAMLTWEIRDNMLASISFAVSMPLVRFS